MLLRKIFALAVCAFWGCFAFYGDALAHEDHDSPHGHHSIYASMPHGWKDLEAPEFVAAFDELLKASPGPTAEHVQEVVTYAWNSFLNDSQFVATGDWNAVQGLISRFAGRRGLIVKGETNEEREASRKKIEQDLESLKLRITSRLEKSPETLQGLAFSEFASSVKILQTVGFDSHDQAAWSAEWMKANAWKSLSLNDQSLLYSYLDADELDPSFVSIRWTGSLQVPADGEYVFEQLRTYYTDGKLKLWINDQLVLDSPGEGQQDGKWKDEPLVDDPAYRSTAITLSSKKAADIRIEYIHNMKDVVLRPVFPMGFPMAVLLWQSPELDRQIIPSTAFTPPKDFTKEKSFGLKGEYYADDSFTQKKATRLDQTIDFVWDHSAIHHRFLEQRTAILSENFPKLTGPTYLASLKDEDASIVANQVLGRFVDGMSATQRLKLMQSLQQQKNLLAKLTYPSFNELMRSLHLLPGKEPLDLLVAWSKTQPQPKSEAGKYPGWGDSYYYTANCDYPWRLGRLLSKPHFEKAKEIWKSHLELENGECNLTLVYMTAFAAKLTHKNLLIREALDERLKDEELTGDPRVTWLIARAYVEETAIFRNPHPGRGMPYLDEALATAESTESRFWVLQEVIARMLTLNQCQKAKSLIASLESQFASNSQKQAMQKWLQLADVLPSYYEEFRQNAHKSAIKSYFSQIKLRKEAAEARGDQSHAEQLEQILASQEPE